MPARPLFRKTLLHSFAALFGLLILSVSQPGAGIDADAVNGSDAAPLAAQKISTRNHLIKTARAATGTSGPIKLTIPKRPDLAEQLVMEQLEAVLPAARGPLPQATPKPTPPNQQKIVETSENETIYELHLSSLKNHAAVAEEMRRLKTRNAGLLDFQALRFDRIAAKKQAPGFTRIYAGNFLQRSEAQALCEVLKRGGQYCSVMKFAK
ncbi:MAG: SPOR domain-containing protein [Pseudomonadota bacterium]